MTYLLKQLTESNTFCLAGGNVDVTKVYVIFYFRNSIMGPAMSATNIRKS